MLFDRLDKDGDGFIRRGEMPKPPPGRDHRVPLDLRKSDKNGDGSVDYGEFLASPLASRLPEERRRHFFDKLDRNGDGKLSPEDRGPQPGPAGRGPRSEQEDPANLFRRLDENGDGKLDFSEFRKAPWVERLGEDAQEDRFEKLDKDGNLLLDPAELVPPRDGKGPAKGRGPRGPRRDPSRDAPDGGKDHAPPMDGEPMMDADA
jgi:Ca2+-binding EF-hand superfamily protein